MITQCIFNPADYIFHHKQSLNKESKTYILN